MCVLRELCMLREVCVLRDLCINGVKSLNTVFLPIGFAVDQGEYRQLLQVRGRS